MRLLDWKPQYTEKFWKGNVVSIGIGGFIEPLESTGLAMMIRGCQYLKSLYMDVFIIQNMILTCIIQE